MKLVYRCLLLPLVLTLLVAGTLAAEQQRAPKREFTKVIKKDFRIAEGGTVDLLNKYGMIDVKTWDQQRVKIEVTIIVQAKGEAEAQQTFDRIDIGFTDNRSHVGAATTIESAKKSWFWSPSSSSDDFKIKYRVFMPRNSKLDIQAKYCNVTVADIQGAVDLDIKYGNFRLDGLGEDSRITSSYGNGSIGEAQDIYLNIAHGACTVTEAKDVVTETKYAKIHIDKAGDIRTETRYDTYYLGDINTLRNSGSYDNFKIDNANEVVIDSRFSNLHAQRIKRVIEAELKNGGITVDQLSKSFERVQLYGHYADFRVSLESNTQFQLDATGDYAGITYPRGMEVTHEIERNTSHEIKGHRGAASAKVIKARLNYGALKLNQ